LAPHSTNPPHGTPTTPGGGGVGVYNSQVGGGPQVQNGTEKILVKNPSCVHLTGETLFCFFCLCWGKAVAKKGGHLWNPGKKKTGFIFFTPVFPPPGQQNHNPPKKHTLFGGTQQNHQQKTRHFGPLPTTPPPFVFLGGCGVGGFSEGKKNPKTKLVYSTTPGFSKKKSWDNPPL